MDSMRYVETPFSMHTWSLGFIVPEGDNSTREPADDSMGLRFESDDALESTANDSLGHFSKLLNN